MPHTLPDGAVNYYESGAEGPRLSLGRGRLEKIRTQEILTRFLPAPPAIVLDVGGGPGVYACWLASRGYEVHLVDAVPLHVEQALCASRDQAEHPLASASVGDARHLDRADESADAALLLGPLYHLTERKDRVAALAEARRVVRRGGLVIAAAISRFASLLDGLVQGFLDDPQFARILQADLRDGQHRNPTGRPEYFTTAFFHLPEELATEMEEAGLRHEETLAVEGPVWLLQNFEDHWADPARRARLLEAARAAEGEASMLGVSAHLLAVARNTA